MGHWGYTGRTTGAWSCRGRVGVGSGGGASDSLDGPQSIEHTHGGTCSAGTGTPFDSRQNMLYSPTAVYHDSTGKRRWSGRMRPAWPGAVTGSGAVT